jgi:hypothetical protein
VTHPLVLGLDTSDFLGGAFDAEHFWSSCLEVSVHYLLSIVVGKIVYCFEELHPIIIALGNECTHFN